MTQTSLPVHLGTLAFIALTGNHTRLGRLRLATADAPGDLLIMTEAFGDDLLVSLWTDTGERGALLAMGVSSIRDITATPRYTRTGQIPSPSQLRQLFEFIFDHPEAIPASPGQ